MKRLSLLLLSLVLSLAFAQQQVEGLDLTPGESAMVRVAHLAAGAANVDVYVNDTNVLGGVAFRDVSEYYLVPAGSIDIRISAAGQDDALIEASLDVEEGLYYTIAALGSGDNLEARVYRDNLRAFPPANGASVRVLHAAQGGAAVDVAVRDGNTLVEGLEFAQVSEYFFVPADSYNLDVRAAGTDNAVLSQDGLEFRAGHIYTVFAIGTGEIGVQDDAMVDEAAEPTEEVEDTDAEAAEAEALEAAPASDMTVGTGGLELVVVVDARIVSEAAENIGTAVTMPAAPAQEPATEEAVTEEEATEEDVTEPEEPATEPEAPEAEEELTEPETPDTEEEELTEPEQPATEPADEEMVGTGTLEIVLEQEGVTVVITGPDGYQESVSGSQTLTGLQPGRYILMATGDGYQATQEEIDLEEGETETVTLELEEE